MKIESLAWADEGRMLVSSRGLPSETYHCAAGHLPKFQGDSLENQKPQFARIETIEEVHSGRLLPEGVPVQSLFGRTELSSQAPVRLHLLWQIMVI